MEFDTMLLCENTKSQIRNLLSMKEIPHLILYGRRGAGKCMVAMKMASWILKTKDPEKHPYFRFVAPEKSTITKTQVDEILAFTDYVGLGRKLYLIDDADSMTDEAQNSLLKLLEDQERNCLVILVAHKPLLPTIESRCLKVNFGQLDEETVLDYLEQQGKELDPVVWMAAGGMPGMYHQLLDSEFSSQLKSIADAVFYGGKADVLRSCGLMKEKDKNVLTARFTQLQLFGFLCYLRSAFAKHMFEGEKVSIRVDQEFCSRVYEAIQVSEWQNKKNQFKAGELLSLVLLINSGKER